MAVHSSTKDKQMRLRIAMEAARILAESGLDDFQAAKRKAAARLGAPDTRNLPSNLEIEAALVEHQRLFESDTQPARLRHLRETARSAMEFFGAFQPRLVGPVLNGTANSHSSVQLHLFAPTPEEVVVFLLEHNIPYKDGERRLRFGREDSTSYPVYRFMAEDVPIELIVFPLDGMRQAPRSPVDGRPMERAGLSRLDTLLTEC